VTGRWTRAGIIAVFGRRGGRPFNLEEMQRMYLRSDATGAKSVWTVYESSADRVPPSAPQANLTAADGRRPQPALHSAHQKR